MRVMIEMTIISIMIRVVVRKKKNGIMWGKFPNWGEGGSDPNPLFDVYLIYLKL